MFLVVNNDTVYYTTMRELFLESGTLSLRLLEKKMLVLRMNLNLTELKQRLTDLFYLFFKLHGALPIYGNLRYTEHLPCPNFGLVENCRHLYLMVLVITYI